MRFAGTGGRETNTFEVAGGRLRFDWSVDECTGAAPHDVLSALLKQIFDADHTLDPGPPSFLGGGGMRVLLSPMIFGQEYGTGGRFEGVTTLDVKAGLYSVNVELPDTCVWIVAVNPA